MPETATRVQLLHPEEKHAPSVSAENYALFEKAILEVLKYSGTPMTWNELQKAIKGYLALNKIRFQGAPAWFAVSIKLHLEAIGRIETFWQKGKKLHKLKEANSLTNNHNYE